MQSILCSTMDISSIRNARFVLYGTIIRGEEYPDKIQGKQINTMSIDKVEQLQVHVENVFFIFGRGSRLSSPTRLHTSLVGSPSNCIFRLYDKNNRALTHFKVS
ncbi:hypothetical protein ANTQUA_LOCUS1718 [Anthophora quadrimaculata]